MWLDWWPGRVIDWKGNIASLFSGKTPLSNQNVKISTKIGKSEKNVANRWKPVAKMNNRVRKKTCISKGKWCKFERKHILCLGKTCSAKQNANKRNLWRELTYNFVGKRTKCNWKKGKNCIPKTKIKRRTENDTFWPTSMAYKKCSQLAPLKRKGNGLSKGLNGIFTLKTQHVVFLGVKLGECFAFGHCRGEICEQSWSKKVANELKDSCQMCLGRVVKIMEGQREPVMALGEQHRNCENP